MGNERLRSRLLQAGMTSAELAEEVEVDPKTVERWVSNGRVPHQRHRLRVARALAAEEVFLWPQLLEDERSQSASRAELREVYPHRGAVPPELWRRLVDDAEEHVDVLVYAGLFLVDAHPDLPAKLVERAGSGLRARLLYGRPESDVVAWRGEDEGIGENLAARIRLSLIYMRPVVGVPGIEVRQHESVLYNSLYRFDDELLVNTHVVGSPAPQNPVLHLQRVPGGHLFEHYMRSFDRVWEAATPVDESSQP